MADKRDIMLQDSTDTGHGYENRQEIYYNDNVGGRAVFVDAKEHYSPDDPVISEAILQERDKDKTPILEVKDLGIDFGGLTAVDSFNIAVGRTEIAGLIGPNGAGKTTIFNMLTKVYEPTRGEIIFNGKSTKGMSTVDINKAGMARTFQNIRLFDKLTVEENIKVALHHTTDYGLLDGMLHTRKYRREEDRIHKEAMRYLKIFGMTKTADYRAGSLPYGAQRRLEIMRALATKPRLLLLDEPAAGMNPSETSDLMSTIKEIRDRFQIAILLIEHDMSLVMGICEGIAVLNYGRTIAKGSPAEIQSNPKVIEAYLGKSRGKMEEEEAKEDIEEALKVGTVASKVELRPDEGPGSGSHRDGRPYRDDVPEALKAKAAGLEALRNEVKAEVKAELAEIKAEDEADFAELKADLAEAKAGLAEAKANAKADFAEAKAGLKAEFEGARAAAEAAGGEMPEFIETMSERGVEKMKAEGRDAKAAREFEARKEEGREVMRSKARAEAEASGEEAGLIESMSEMGVEKMKAQSRDAKAAREFEARKEEGREAMKARARAEREEARAEFRDDVEAFKADLKGDREAYKEFKADLRAEAAQAKADFKADAKNGFADAKAFAKADLEDAKAGLEEAQAKVKAQAEEAKAELRNAVEIQNEAVQEDIAEAKADFADAKAKVAEAKAEARAEFKADVEGLKADLEDAKAGLEEAQAKVKAQAEEAKADAEAIKAQVEASAASGKES